MKKRKRNLRNSRNYVPATAAAIREYIWGRVFRNDELPVLTNLAAISDPDNPPISRVRLRRMRRVSQRIARTRGVWAWPNRPRRPTMKAKWRHP